MSLKYKILAGKQRKMLHELRMVEYALKLKEAVDALQELCARVEYLSEEILSAIYADDEGDEEINLYSQCSICEEEFIGSFDSEDICKRCVDKV